MREKSTLTLGKALYEGERVTLKREGPSACWHGRTDDGELVIKHQYRHDAQLFLEADGYEWQMDYSGGN